MKPAMLAAAAGALAAAALGAAAVLPRLTAASPDAVTIGGPFSLTDAAGHSVTDRDFRGRWMLIYFGYTHCPDACPTTLSDMAAALDKLSPAERARVAPLFITVDPDRDLPAVIGDYAHAFGPTFVGLTGTHAQITDIETKFRVYAARHPLKGGDYAMDHSSIIYVMGLAGQFVGVLGDDLKPQEMAERLRGFGV